MVYKHFSTYHHSLEMVNMEQESDENLHLISVIINGGFYSFNFPSFHFFQVIGLNFETVTKLEKSCKYNTKNLIS